MMAAKMAVKNVTEQWALYLPLYPTAEQRYIRIRFSAAILAAILENFNVLDSPTLKN